MEDLSQPTTETMIAEAVVIVLILMEEGGGLATALIVYSPDLTPMFTGADTTASLMWR